MFPDGGFSNAFATRLGVAALVVAVLAGWNLYLSASSSAEPKYKIEDVMKTAMKGGLCKKCASGKASDDEKKELVELFTALSENKPPKGEAESWKAKTSTLVAAAKAVASGEKGAGKKLGAAANCKACHDVHK